MSIGSVFSTAFSVFGARARVLVPIAFGSALLLRAVTALSGEDGVGFIISFIVDMAFFAFVQATVMVVLRDMRERRPDSSARELLASALPPLPAATLAAFLDFVGFTLGFVLLVVPGLYLMTIWAVLLPVVVAERPGVFDAFGRSRQLIRGNGWKVFGVILLLGLILVGSALLAIAFHRQVEGEVPAALFGSLISSIVTPIEALVLGVLYFRLLETERAGPAESVLEQPGDSAG